MDKNAVDLLPEALTVPEVMAALRLSRAKVYDLIRSKQLASFTVGRSRRIPPTAVQAFIAGRLEDTA